MHVLTLLFLVGIAASPAFAHPAGHGDEDYYRPAPKAAAPTATVIPDTYAGIVAALREGLTNAETALTASKIVDLHRSCGVMKDLATATPPKSGFLSATEQSTVATTSAHLQTKAAELVTAADKGDTTAGRAAIVAIKADVEVLAGFAK